MFVWPKQIQTLNNFLCKNYDESSCKKNWIEHRGVFYSIVENVLNLKSSKVVCKLITVKSDQRSEILNFKIRLKTKMSKF